MKRLLRLFLINATAIYLTSLSFPGLVLLGDILHTLSLSAGILLLLNTFLRPILNLFLLPINILTLGLLRWFINLLNVFLLSLIVPQFTLVSFFFPGKNIAGVILPEIQGGKILALFISSLLISLISHILSWVTD